MQKPIASLTILYNPEEGHFQNIVSYAGQVDWMIFVDNSTADHGRQIHEALPWDKKDKASYVPNHANLGVARALNQGAHEALRRGYSLLLTMDQDSWATEKMVEKLCLAHGRLGYAGERVALVSAMQVQKERFSSWSRNVCSNDESPCIFPLVVPTSGNVLDLRAYRRLGPFVEEYFIDDVDHEYCLRAHRSGYVVAQVQDAPLVHSCGTVHRSRLRKKDQGLVYEHAPVRHYYMLRNRLATCTKYSSLFFPRVLVFYIRILGIQIVHGLVFETSRARKLGAMFQGLWDWARKRMGK